MPRKSKTRHSTPKLSEAVRHLVIPDGIVTTGWPRVRAKAADLGILFDPWQDGAHTITLGKRADGKYAATVGGVVWSIPRQVGKTYSIGALLIVMCILFPGFKVVWTAHHGRTSTSAFRSMSGMCRRKKILPHIALDARGKPAMRTSNGEQEIIFRNGSMIMFGARAQGFGRGFDVVDAEVFDEAQILPEKALEDMIAATNQSKHPHGALIFFIGTPPRPSDPSEAFMMKRAKALRGAAPGESVRVTRGDMIYIEMSADRDADLDDRTQWLKANASYPTRTPEESMLRLRENLATDDAWKREGLGIWDEIGKTHVFGPNGWEDVAAPGTNPDDVAAIGLGVSVERDSASIAAVDTSGEFPLVGVSDRRDGVGWLVPEAKRLQDKYGCAVVIRGSGPGSDLIPALEAAGVKLTIAKANDYADACAGIFDAVREQRIRHSDHPALNLSVAGAHKRRRDDRWIWDPRNSDSDTAMLVGATLAHWAATQPDKPRRVPMASIV